MKELEKDPLSVPQKYEIPQSLDPKAQLSAEEAQSLHSILLRLGEVVKKHKILLKPHF